MKYPIVLLDADDTLVDFRAAEAWALRTVLEGRDIPADGETIALYSRINRGWWERFERGECTREELVWRRFAEFFPLVGAEADPKAAQGDYARALAECAFLIPGAEALCRELKARGHRLYVVTNGIAAVQRRRLSASGLDRYLEDIFISEELGSQKPAAAFFDRVFEALGQPRREDCIILGDSQTSDMPGGKNAGIATCWYNPGDTPKTGDWDYEINRLKDFLEVVS